VLVDLKRGVALRTQLCKALAGYQKLCPNIFLQMNFNPAKLLPSSQACSVEDHLPQKQELAAIMKLVENYCMDSGTLVGNSCVGII